MQVAGNSVVLGVMDSTLVDTDNVPVQVEATVGWCHRTWFLVVAKMSFLLMALDLLESDPVVTRDVVHSALAEVL